MVTLQKLRVLLVDDQNLFREGLASLLSSHSSVEVVGEAENGREAIERARKLLPDLVLMDVHMPGCDSIEPVRTIKREMPQIKIIMLGTPDNDNELMLAIKNGADAYLLKNLDPEQFFAVLDGIQRGMAPITNMVAERILLEFRKMSAMLQEADEYREQLTPKEIETLELLIRGDSNKEIADVLNISESTVKLHLRTIMQKLHIQNRTQLAAYAVSEGLVHIQHE